MKLLSLFAGAGLFVMSAFCPQHAHARELIPPTTCDQPCLETESHGGHDGHSCCAIDHLHDQFYRLFSLSSPVINVHTLTPVRSAVTTPPGLPFARRVIPCDRSEPSGDLPLLSTVELRR